MHSSNPVLSQKMFQGQAIASREGAMTLEGTINKTILSVLLVMGSAYWAYHEPSFFMPLTIPLMIGGLILALIISFKHTLAPLLTPVYAIVEGFVLGGISLLYASLTAGTGSSSFEAPLGINNEIVFQAIALTFGTLFAMLVAYRSGVIKVTEKFRMMVFAATGGICLVYLVAFVMNLFGVQMPFLHDGGPLGIGISLFVVGIAALNLVLDFDFITTASRSGNLPKHMEWFGAFGLLVTLIWLYIEMLRLLSQLARSRD